MGGIRIALTASEAADANCFPAKHMLTPDYCNDICEGVITFESFKKLLPNILMNFPMISEDEIQDRSKKNALSKAFAFVQLAWFIIQFLARLGEGLAVTELEITTVSLASLNSVMYLCWRDKPMDVRYPITIRSRAASDLLRQTNNIPWTVPNTQLANSTFCQSCRRILNIIKFLPRRFLNRCLRAAKGVIQSITSGAMGTLLGYPIRIPSMATLCRYAVLTPIRVIHIPVFIPALAIGAMLFTVPHIVRRGLDSIDEDPRISLPLSMMFHSYSPNVQNEDQPSLMVYSALAGLLFGLPHFLTWNNDFTTHKEQIVWRYAASAILGSCAAALVTGIFWWCFPKSVESFSKIMNVTRSSILPVNQSQSWPA